MTLCTLTIGKECQHWNSVQPAIDPWSQKKRMHSQRWYSDWSTFIVSTIYSMAYGWLIYIIKCMLGCPIQEPHLYPIKYSNAACNKQYAMQLTIPKSKVHFSSRTLYFWNILDVQNVECHRYWSFTCQLIDSLQQTLWFFHWTHQMLSHKLW